MKKPRSHSESGSRRRRISRHYEPKLQRARENYRALDWASQESQEARFAALARAVPLAGRKLLDVGSGLGDLLTWLQRRAIHVDYTGVDILDAMVRQAQMLHPEGQFVQGDVFDPGEAVFAPASFDVVFCSGIFNLNLGNNAEFLAAALPRLIDLTREHVVFNLLHKRAAWGVDPDYFHFDPAEVRDILRPLDVQATFHDDYLPNDFTVVLRRPAEA